MRNQALKYGKMLSLCREQSNLNSSSPPSLSPSLPPSLPPSLQAQDLREEDMQIVSHLVESEQSRGGALRKVLVVGDVEQTVFSDVLTGRSKGHPMDLLSSWMPSVTVNTRRLDVNYRCPHAHVAFNNLALPRSASMGEGPVKPSPEMTDLSARGRHKPYLFTYVQSSSTVQNYDAYRTACRIAEMVLVLLKTMEGLTLRDIAITSRYVVFVSLWLDRCVFGRSVTFLGCVIRPLLCLLTPSLPPLPFLPPSFPPSPKQIRKRQPHPPPTRRRARARPD